MQHFYRLLVLFLLNYLLRIGKILIFKCCLLLVSMFDVNKKRSKTVTAKSNIFFKSYQTAIICRHAVKFDSYLSIIVFVGIQNDSLQIDMQI